jgi:prepilin-type N-terminal cleavage/methylation domain-containing protein
MKRGGNTGFTLLELLIALTLSALLITVLSLGLRSGLVSWMKLRESNQIVLPQRAVEALLTRQLRAAEIPNGQGGESPAVFLGKKDSLTFTTNYAPIGTEAAGMILVTYAQDRAGGGLLYAQRVLTKTEELQGLLPVELTPERLTGLRKKGWITARVTIARELRFAYQRKDEVGEKAPEQWKDSWEDEGSLPFSVAIQWQEAKGTRPAEAAWRIFELAPFQKSGKNGVLATTSTPPGGTAEQGGIIAESPGVPKK